MISLSYWDFALGCVAFVSLAINVLQFARKRMLHNHAAGTYSQLWDIITEIDAKRITDPFEIKRLIDQSRIQLIALNRSIGSDEAVIRPWNFCVEARRKSYEDEMSWNKRKSQLQQKLAELEELKPK